MSEPKKKAFPRRNAAKPPIPKASEGYRRKTPNEDHAVMLYGTMGRDLVKSAKSNVIAHIMPGGKLERRLNDGFLMSYARVLTDRKGREIIIDKIPLSTVKLFYRISSSYCENRESHIVVKHTGIAEERYVSDGTSRTPVTRTKDALEIDVLLLMECKFIVPHYTWLDSGEVKIDLKPLNILDTHYPEYGGKRQIGEHLILAETFRNYLVDHCSYKFCARGIERIPEDDPLAFFIFCEMQDHYDIPGNRRNPKTYNVLATKTLLTPENGFKTEEEVEKTSRWKQEYVNPLTSVLNRLRDKYQLLESWHFEAYDANRKRYKPTDEELKKLLKGRGIFELLICFKIRNHPDDNAEDQEEQERRDKEAFDQAERKMQEGVIKAAEILSRPEIRSVIHKVNLLK